ncbi:deoxyribodipyrimidine photolyase [Megavirus courdo11]|nr:deoxyribodipyrimidine photolyase [Megavirus courdo11]
MSKKNNISIHIFRRDLRLEDNTSLLLALQESKYVIPLFIFTPTQVSEKNKLKSSNSIQFMIESLYDLNSQINFLDKKLRLWTTYGNEIDVIDEIHKNINVSAIYINDDYTPYSIKRDKKIQNYCDQQNIILNISTDILLTDTLDIAANNGNRYHNFGLYYKKAINIIVRKPSYNVTNNFLIPTKIFKKWTIENMDIYLLDNFYYVPNKNLAVNGGRENGLQILENNLKFKNYKTDKNNISIKTTRLSAHNKFGTISIREVYQKFNKNIEIIKNLYWRDFYYYVSVHFYDRFYSYQHIFKNPTTKNLPKWENNKKYFEAWKNGCTGFPIVDAAMRELNTTGFMHNRGRLITSQFLIKDLLVDWKYGEKYFSKKLVDIDRVQNLGNWNWSASYGLDSSPYLRIFNPWSQSRTYDPDCEYIKYWIPELLNIPAKDLHNWNKNYKKYDANYPKPIVDHSIMRNKFINFYKKYFKK